MRLALFQPDIPQNSGTIIRLCACLGVPLDIIEPCGFTFTDKQLRRAAMDYASAAEIERHLDWARFEAAVAGRLVLLTSRSRLSYLDFDYRNDDVLLFGREAAGVPDEVHARADASLTIPMQPGARSLNVAVAAGIVLGEALRQTTRARDGSSG